MRKLIIALLALWILPLAAQNLDTAIRELTQDIKGQVVSPATTSELQNLFKDATIAKVPRIFVDKLPPDFATNGSPELYMHIITALILRSNEQALKEKMLLLAMKNKYEKNESWSETEENFFNALVEKYDVVITKTRQTQLDQLTLKIGEIVPGLAVAQSVYATDWGTKNMNHPYGQMGWIDEKTYTELPYDSLIQATEAYFKDMNSTNSYWMWHTRRLSSAYRRQSSRLAYNLAGSLDSYRPEDPLYTTTLQQILLNNQPLSKLYQATFIEE